MRSSDDLDPLLAQFHPVGPPPELRARVLQSARYAEARPNGGRAKADAIAEWLPAAAALVFVLLFHWLATTEQERIAAHFSFDPVEISADVMQGLFND